MDNLPASRQQRDVRTGITSFGSFVLACGKGNNQKNTFWEAFSTKNPRQIHLQYTSNIAFILVAFLFQFEEESDKEFKSNIHMAQSILLLRTYQKYQLLQSLFF